jgi:hypothetical protein
MMPAKAMIKVSSQARRFLAILVTDETAKTISFGELTT